jgi:acetyl esterase/lipase
MRAKLVFCNVAWMLLLGTLAQAEDWRSITPDVVYGHKHGMALTYDVVKPTQKANGGIVLFMVSGGWFSMYQPPEDVVRGLPDGATEPKNPNLFEKIVQNGYTLVFVRHGSAPLFKVPDAVDDVKLAIKHIRANAKEYGCDPEKIGVCGGSAGGHLSLVLGTMGEDGDQESDDPKLVGSRVKAVVAYFPPTDLRTYVNHKELSKQFPALVFQDSKAEAVSPLLAVTSDDAPALLIHGDKDELVPLWHSEKIREELDKNKVPCKLIVMKGAAHGFNPKQNQEAEAELLAWFDKYLLDKSSEAKESE